MNTFNLVVLLYALNGYALCLDALWSSEDIARADPADRPAVLFFSCAMAVGLALVPGLAAAVVFIFHLRHRWRVLSQVIHHQEE